MAFYCSSAWYDSIENVPQKHDLNDFFNHFVSFHWPAHHVVLMQCACRKFSWQRQEDESKYLIGSSHFYEKEGQVKG